MDQLIRKHILWRRAMKCIVAFLVMAVCAIVIAASCKRRTYIDVQRAQVMETIAVCGVNVCSSVSSTPLTTLIDKYHLASGESQWEIESATSLWTRGSSPHFALHGGRSAFTSLAGALEYHNIDPDGASALIRATMAEMRKGNIVYVINLGDGIRLLNKGSGPLYTWNDRSH
jgi:hypothetical protein